MTRKVIALVGILVLSSFVGLAAQKYGGKATAKGATHTFSGKVTAWSADSFTVESSGAVPESKTFQIGAGMVKTGTPQVGSEVTVKYTEMGGAMQAKSVKVVKAKTAKMKKT
ncbi:MAG: hypothetical protein HY644_00550 [Acidobacteria bacterium]|nr:hypothetical protein [Acidobacteriota bacterium]